MISPHVELVSWDLVSIQELKWIRQHGDPSEATFCQLKV